MKKISLLLLAVMTAVMSFSQTVKLTKFKGVDTVIGIPKNYALAYCVMDPSTEICYVVLEPMDPKVSYYENFLLYIGKNILVKKIVTNAERYKDGGTTIVTWKDGILTFPTPVCSKCRPKMTNAVTAATIEMEVVIKHKIN